jgi:hypothetical protein
MGRILKTGASLVIGLTLAATAAVSTIPAEAATRWRAAGVKLPHSAGKQYRIGKKISKSQLRNGDLVFYRGISHVGLYAGNGKVIHGPRPGKKVSYIKMSYMPYAGARRPG